MSIVDSNLGNYLTLDMGQTNHKHTVSGSNMSGLPNVNVLSTKSGLLQTVFLC